MGFFQGASNVRITGGEFNNFENGGKEVVFNQSRHYTNVNSFNTVNNATIDSHNDHSKASYGVDPDITQPIREKDQNRLKENGSGQKNENFSQYFPPPAIHPVMQPAFLPPGDPANVTTNVNSFNVDNNRMSNAHNDYSQQHNLPPPPSTSKRPGRRRRAVPEEYQNSESGVDNDEYANPPDPSSYYHRPHPYAVPPPSTRSHPHSPQHRSLYAQGHSPGNYSSAQYTEGQIQNMGDPVRQTLEQLMRLVKEQTAPQPNPEYAIPPYHGSTSQETPEEYEDECEDEDEDEEDGGEEDEDKADEEDETDEEDARMVDPPTTLAHQIGNLSLNETLRPAFSRVKSDPEFQPTSNFPQSLNVPPTDPRRTGSAQDIPAHLQEPFVPQTPYTASSQDSLPYNQEGYGPSHASGSLYSSPSPSQPSWSPNIAPPNITPLQPSYGPPPGSLPAAFRLDISSIQGPAVFNNIKGDYVKIDRSVHTQNIHSGNTHNTVIKDSFNNHSVATYYASPEPAPKRIGKQGRMPPRKR